MLVHSASDGTAARVSRVSNQRSERALIETLSRRANPWEARWQEAVEARVLHRPWGEAEPWWDADTPQEAWDTCPSGEALLWVLSRGYLTHPDSLYYELGMTILKKMGANEGRAYVALMERTYATPAVRIHVARTWENMPWDPTTVEEARSRAGYAVALSCYGFTPPFFELAYLSRVFCGVSDADLAHLIRRKLPGQRWTTGL